MQDEKADAIQIINDWFDVFNSRRKYAPALNKCKAALGLFWEDQERALLKMLHLMENMVNTELLRHSILKYYWTGEIAHSQLYAQLLAIFRFIDTTCPTGGGGSTSNHSHAFKWTDRYSTNITERYLKVITKFILIYGFDLILNHH